MSDNKSNNIIEVALIGPSGVGKTSLAKRLRTGIFLKEHVSTTGVNVAPIMLETGRVVNVWDCGGKTENREFKNINICIGVWDVSDPEGFKQLLPYLEKFRESNPQTELWVVGNKVDKMRKREPITVLAKTVNVNRKYTISVKACFGVPKLTDDLGVFE